jgi:hypothetical protein
MHERVRRVSAHDIRRRAYAEAQRLVANVNFSSPEVRAHARQQALDDNLARHSQALAEHEKKVQEALPKKLGSAQEVKTSAQILISRSWARRKLSVSVGRKF